MSISPVMFAFGICHASATSTVFEEKSKVQIKSTANAQDFQAFLDRANDEEGFARFYFVVHNPSENLTKKTDNPRVRVWMADEIARKVLDYGLTHWLIEKAK